MGRDRERGRGREREREDRGDGMSNRAASGPSDRQTRAESTVPKAADPTCTEMLLSTAHLSAFPSRPKRLSLSKKHTRKEQANSSTPAMKGTPHTGSLGRSAIPCPNQSCIGGVGCETRDIYTSCGAHC
jgi:hypothetical protein